MCHIVSSLAGLEALSPAVIASDRDRSGTSNVPIIIANGTCTDASHRAVIAVITASSRNIAKCIGLGSWRVRTLGLVVAHLPALGTLDARN